MRISAVVATLGVVALIVFAACDPRDPPTRADLEADARKLLETKIVVKDQGSNLCLVVLDGLFAKRPVFQTYIVRCKSEKHVLDPVTE
jgi:hypothetical protein